MSFVPPQDDKIKKMGKKEKIPAYIYADPDDPTVIYIKTNGVIQIVDNSKYQVVINNLLFKDGDCAEKYTSEFITDISPCYINIDEVLGLCSGMRIDKESVLLHIRAACEIIDYWAKKDDVKFTKENIKDNYYPFYMYVKYKAAVESLKEFYIGAITHPFHYVDELSDLSREEEMDFGAIQKLLDHLDKEAEDWLNQIITITADPEWALRGKYSRAIDIPGYKHYHDTFIDSKGGGNGWRRGY